MQAGNNHILKDFDNRDRYIGIILMYKGEPCFFCEELDGWKSGITLTQEKIDITDQSVMLAEVGFKDKSGEITSAEDIAEGFDVGDVLVCVNPIQVKRLQVAVTLEEIIEGNKLPKFAKSIVSKYFAIHN